MLSTASWLADHAAWLDLENFSALTALFTSMRRSDLGKAKRKSYPFIVKNFSL